MRLELRENEEVILKTKKHWLILVRSVLIFELILLTAINVLIKYKEWEYIGYLTQLMIFITLAFILSFLYRHWDIDMDLYIPLFFLIWFAYLVAFIFL